MIPEFKVVILGDQCVGKSTFMRRAAMLSKQPYEFAAAAIGRVDAVRVSLKYKEKDQQILLVDCGVVTQFRTLTGAFYKNTSAVLLMFSLGSRESFHNIQTWLSVLHMNIPSKIPVILVGNGNDMGLRREVAYQEASIYANEISCNGYYETSAMLGDGVDFVLNRLCDLVHERYLRFLKQQNERETVQPIGVPFKIRHQRTNMNKSYSFHMDRKHSKKRIRNRLRTLAKRIFRR